MFTALYFLFNFSFGQNSAPATNANVGGPGDGKKKNEDFLFDYYLRMLLLES